MWCAVGWLVGVDVSGESAVSVFANFLDCYTLKTGAGRPTESSLFIIWHSVAYNMTSLSPASSPDTRPTVQSAHVRHAWISEWPSACGDVCWLSMGQFNVTAADFTSQTALTCIRTLSTVTDYRASYTALNNPWPALRRFHLYFIFSYIFETTYLENYGVSYICAFVQQFFLIYPL